VTRDTNPLPGQFAPKPGERVFLSAEWRDLVILNYEVDPLLLHRYVPPGTELDTFDGKTFVSLVGFRFLQTKIFGFAAVPFHANFDEVNLRLYVRRPERSEVRRGVVFIREIVPRTAIALVANLGYGENYSAHPMRHSISLSAHGGPARYEWRLDEQWCGIEANAAGTAKQPAEGSFERFITEHYWGYSARRGNCFEYRVAHEPWRVWASSAARFYGNAEPLYGSQLGAIIHPTPDSALIAEGSPVLVFTGRAVARRAYSSV
jgi:uncharacterized protein YqjF (DUF2071 family)